VLVSVLALVGFALAMILFVMAVLVNRPSPHEALGQELTTPAASSPPEASAPALAPSPEFTQRLLTNSEPTGIPNLDVMEVIGNLKHFSPMKSWVCEGPLPAEGERILWACHGPANEASASYEVTVVGKNPLTIFSVEATVRGVSEERAAGFFTYIASLCLQETDPLNPKAWVEQNVGSGGHVIAEGTELFIYGTQEERTLQVVATGLTTN
jgi:hypothetical protein